MRWIAKKMGQRNESFDDLIKAYSEHRLDEVIDQTAKSILLRMRWRAAVQTWVNVTFSLVAPFGKVGRSIWEICNGEYRRASKEVHSGSNSAPSGSAGASGGSGPHPQQSAGLTIGSVTRLALATQFTRPSPGAGARLAQQRHMAAIAVGFLDATADPPQPLEDAGIKAGEIVAYRCWRLCDGKLHSVYQEHVVWEPSQTMEGKLDDDEGVHAFKDRLSTGYYGFEYRCEKVTIVSGTVDLWGEIIEHELGYRAQFAAIASIDDSPFYDAKALRKLYGLTRKRKKKE